MGLLLKKRSAPTTIIAVRGTKRSGIFRCSNPTSSDTSSVNTTYSTSCSTKKVVRDETAAAATRKRVHFDESLNQVHHHDHNSTDVTNEELWYSPQEIQRFLGLHLLMVRELVRTQTSLVQLIDQTAAECYKQQVKPKFSIRRSKVAKRESCVSTTQSTSSSRVVVVPQHIKAQIIQQLAAVEESVGLEAALVDPATLERQRQQLLKAAQSTSSSKHNSATSSSLACQTLSQPSQCLARVWAQCHAYDQITDATKQGTTSSATSKCVGLF